MKNNSGGKGSASRPLSVSRQEFGNNFDAIFGKKKEDNTTLSTDVLKVVGHAGNIPDEEFQGETFTPSTM